MRRPGLAERVQLGEEEGMRRILVALAFVAVLTVGLGVPSASAQYYGYPYGYAGLSGGLGYPYGYSGLYGGLGGG